MQLKKTRKEIVALTYLKKKDIQILLGISYRAASDLYEKADRFEKEDLKDYRIEPTKVRMSTVCKIAKLNFGQLVKQIEFEERTKKALA